MPDGADDAGRNFYNRLVYGGETLEPDAQSPEAVPPCEGALDDPDGSRLSHCRAARNVQWPAIFVVVVASVGLQTDEP